jgi:hypothetical protein
MVPAGQTDPEDHLENSKNDRNLHLQAVQHRYPNRNNNCIHSHFWENTQYS